MIMYCHSFLVGFLTSFKENKMINTPTAAVKIRKAVIVTGIKLVTRSFVAITLNPQKPLQQIAIYKFDIDAY